MNKEENSLNNFNIKFKSKLKGKNKSKSICNNVKERGITLIALVITIVILIILATISINAVLGEDGLIKRAETASQHQANAEAEDREALGVLDGHIANAIAGNGSNSGGTGEGQLQISYEIENIDASGKAVKLSYSVVKGETTAKDIEAKIEELIGVDITDEIRNGAKTEANSIGITYEEFLLENLVQEIMEVEITEEIRLQVKAEAENAGMTYQEMLEYGLEQEGITFSPELVTIAELEEMYVELAKSQGEEVIFDETTREQIMQQAAPNGMTYREYLKAILEIYGVDTSGVNTNVKQGERGIGVAKSEFIATRNGTYTVKTKAKNGMQAEIEIEVEGIVEEKFSKIKTTTETYTEGNLTAKIPAGFAVGISEGINTIAGGLVITDAVDENGYSIGNEYVWIPVGEDEGDFEREDFQNLSETEWTHYTEPLDYNGVTGYTNEEVEYNTMRTQVLAHHGFYIARYEAGINSTEFRKYPTEGAQEVVSKRGVVPYNYVPWGASMTDINSDVECEANEGETVNTKGAVYLAQNMYAGKEQSNSVTSTLCYGVQWDAMCRYIEDYTRTTPTKNGVDVTGRIGGDNSKNIYDLAGNCFEWTMEADDGNRRVGRGGDYYDSSPVSNRNLIIPTRNRDCYCFRFALYISAPES